ncbi:hypothetical protein CRG98_028076 [Punica granatum]|uniref:Uncharacterized protein n=1 Tax=Punica granatum TaxID=22663 RepID=A0A2I0J736_PUNGR|nr:hypothetical protein CRG98_028076 [Punica granatum]
MEFMKDSENPNLFPTKKQLLHAGRANLVERFRGGVGGFLWAGTWNLKRGVATALMMLISGRNRMVGSIGKTMNSDEQWRE